ncbi:MAG: UDP-N-acetylglucosamine 1-carboxyvinyltransferase [Candidatus Zixiibacteriota bacterium]|nr:MAG: UDP-N-acetylglucosamine 1-carboxyvinyltransferase [candidate division Zixibacteria bacterium]
MDKFIIDGGRKLNGSVRVSGAKNAALPIIVASLLAEKGKTVLSNVPNLMDIRTISGVIEGLGARVNFDINSEQMEIDATSLKKHTAPYELVRKMRASFLVMGPLLSRLGRARVSLPGGCVLGPRPVDQHILGFQKLGARITESKGYISASAKFLKGTAIFFDRPSHTGTENIMMAAVLARGKTTIINAGCDPEIVDLAEFLNKMGAIISGAGTPRIEVTGVKNLRAAAHSVIPDRLEAGTFMLAVGACGGSVEISGIIPQHNEILISKMSESGVKLKIAKDKMTVSRDGRPNALKITTYPYPGFPTDLQAAAMAYATICKGTSQIRETVFTERFTHIMELIRLGADIKITGDEAIVSGVDGLKGASIMASDIRAGAGLVIAALAAGGQSEILRVYHIDRGYQRIEEKLARIGGNIKRVAV